LGVTSGSPRQIEIWFAVCRERFYLFPETGETAGWVKNIGRNPEVTVRFGERQTARGRVCWTVKAIANWDEVTAIAYRKYEWGDGLPVEITPPRSIS
jgi:F420H(2)-dependent quinone reductase